MNTVVLDFENTGYPVGGGWSPIFHIGAVFVKDDVLADTFSVSGQNAPDELRAWLSSLGDPEVTSYNHDFDKRRAESLGLTLTWGTDIKSLASDAVNKDGSNSTLPNGFKKWPSLDEVALFLGLTPRTSSVHDPLYDARLAAQVLIALLKRKSPMPVQATTQDGKPGFKYGDAGHVYTYEPGDEKAMNEAKRKAYIQGYAIQKSEGSEGKTP
jgi:hypothetical protein